MAEVEPSLNIPSLLTLAVVSFFVIRWFFSRPGDGNGDSSDSSRGTRPRVDPAQVEQIAQMFPQLSRREIMWDLQRNGGSVAATTERVLAGLGLETPPPYFQPNIVASPSPASTAASTSPAPSKPPVDDLISRYNLSSRLQEEVSGSTTGVDTGSDTIMRSESTWSQNKMERQRLLQKRRDDMILAARRKMLEKDRVAAQL
ncbi:AMFR protein [Coccidioides immitis RS]|uniref:Coupling of ubiquitin conjugation to ER degradation protein 1 n=3 Tax=Coccidioides immitis TaxID=5501 RepID=A0A0E1RVW4_COCIM|nr:AMFR protein [Coccidioides immitis RS]EAS29235.1 AMFR protein [Coccidioides immitis RS]KMP06362.1 hypothetical protein CIRG_06043 [Coccidioides immitis RMSCC 2394]KMU80435.1 hypothetical protein CISG_02286 [Coccidioides immitis RMSCC 3703]